jgi:hypothetical protein
MRHSTKCRKSSVAAQGAVPHHVNDSLLRDADGSPLKQRFRANLFAESSSIIAERR